LLRVAETDQRHRATTAFIWELPLYRGKRDFRGQMLGGWQLNGSFNIETGLPMHPSPKRVAYRRRLPALQPFPDRLADGHLDSSRRTLDRWFHPPVRAGARALRL
jgi:hypothetical protein